MDPFDLLDRDPVWQEFHRQEALDPRQVNLTAIWRVAYNFLYGSGERVWLSPRRWRRSYGGPEAVKLEGPATDAPAWADASTALEYMFDMDNVLAQVFIEVFRTAGQRDPAGMMLWAPGAAVRAHLAFLAPAWDKYGPGGIPRDLVARDLLAEVARRTERLGVYVQETKVAEVQRAFLWAQEYSAGSTGLSIAWCLSHLAYHHLGYRLKPSREGRP
jgi:hypothetical protein